MNLVSPPCLCSDLYTQKHIAMDLQLVRKDKLVK